MPIIEGGLEFENAGAPGNGTSEVQTLEFGGAPTGGTFTLTFDGHTTAAITWISTDDAALIAAIDAALEALPNIGTAGVTVADGTLTAGVGTVTITFGGNLAKLAVPLITYTSSLTGAAPTITITETTPGVTADFRGAKKGAVVNDTTNAKLYKNDGTALEPSWNSVGDIATAEIADDAVTNAKLANITRGSVKVGGASDAPTDLDAKTSGQILVGDGTDLKSVAVSGDATLAANGAVTVVAATDSVAGKIELATTGETITGTAVDRAVTPAGLAGAGFAPSVPVAGATFVVGAEGGNVINVAVQLRDATPADLAVRGSVLAYLSDDANGDSIATAAPSAGVAIGTDGLAIPIVAGKAFLLTSESDGDIDLNVSEAGVATWYLIVVLPNGLLVKSDAITFA